MYVCAHACMDIRQVWSTKKVTSIRNRAQSLHTHSCQHDAGEISLTSINPDRALHHTHTHTYRTLAVLTQVPLTLHLRGYTHRPSTTVNTDLTPPLYDVLVRHKVSMLTSLPQSVKINNLARRSVSLIHKPASDKRNFICLLLCVKNRQCNLLKQLMQ